MPKRHYKEDYVITLLDEGLKQTKIVQKTGLTKGQVRHIIEKEQIRREAQADFAGSCCELSITAQQKIDAAIRRVQRQLNGEFERRVSDEVARRVDEIVLPHWRDKLNQAQQLYARRNGLMSKDTFNTIRRALHPDSRGSITDKKLAEAFNSFMSLEKYLLNEKDSPTEFGRVPNSLEEWDRMRVKRTSRKGRAVRRTAK